MNTTVYCQECNTFPATRGDLCTVCAPANESWMVRKVDPNTVSKFLCVQCGIRHTLTSSTLCDICKDANTPARKQKGLSFSYVLAWLRKTPTGKATRWFWNTGEYIAVYYTPLSHDERIMIILDGHPPLAWVPTQSDILAKDWELR